MLVSTCLEYPFIKVLQLILQQGIVWLILCDVSIFCIIVIFDSTLLIFLNISIEAPEYQMNKIFDLQFNLLTGRSQVYSHNVLDYYRVVVAIYTRRRQSGSLVLWNLDHTRNGSCKVMIRIYHFVHMGYLRKNHVQCIALLKYLSQINILLFKTKK